MCVRSRPFDGWPDRGQSSDPEQPNYHGAGLPLIPGKIELITASDPVELRGIENEYVHELKVLAWRGPDYIAVPCLEPSGCGLDTRQLLVALSTTDVCNPRHLRVT